MNLTKLNKTRARKAFNAGHKIVFALNKTHPTSIFSTWFQKSYKTNDFDSLVRNFEHYNACYELGYRTSYYLQENHPAI